MPRIIDLSGRRFGRLLVLRRDGSLGIRPAWLCQCDCGKIVRVRGGDLRSGHHRSCGCLQRDVVTKHGHWLSPTYNTWQSMKARCSNPNATGYKSYGGRGIRVCEHWLTFDNFLADMSERPGLQYTLDRIDYDGDYEPGNCRWVTRKRQARNRRNVPLHAAKGHKLWHGDWADATGLNQATIRGRHRLGWTTEDAISKPVGFCTKYGGPPHKDMKGRRFGMLEVLSYSHTRNKRAYWLCRCDCGREFITEGKAIRQGKTKSCGCKRGRPPSPSASP